MNYDYLERFREERNALKVSQKKIAEYLECSSTVICLKERGEREFTGYELYRIYEKFGIEAGFQKVYQAIDTGKIKKFLEKNTVYQIVSLGLDELRVIEEKDYKNITLYTIKKIKKIIDYEIRDEDMEFIYLKFNERKELKNLIELYYRKDGDIKRALDLLKIAIRP